MTLFSFLSRSGTRDKRRRKVTASLYDIKQAEGRRSTEQEREREQEREQERESEAEREHARVVLYEVRPGYERASYTASLQHGAPHGSPPWYGGPAVLQMGEQPDAELRDPRDVVVKVYAASLNPIDYKRRQGALKFIVEERWPHIVGYDISGVVITCGTDVKKFKVGDAVFGMLPHDRNGALAELVGVHEDYLAKKPANLTHVQAASLPLVTLTALMSFRAGNLEEGKKVLVTGGAGGVGSIAVQVAKRVFMAQTVATTASTKKIERMKTLGADEVIDYTRESFERELAEYDFALDCTGETKKCFECVTKNGSVISISETPTPQVLQDLGAKGIAVSRFISFVLGCLSHSVVKRARQAQINYDYFFAVGDGAVMDEIKELSEQRVISPVIDKVYPFEKADTAMEYLEAGHAMGKVVVELVTDSV